MTGVSEPLIQAICIYRWTQTTSPDPSLVGFQPGVGSPIGFRVNFTIQPVVKIPFWAIVLPLTFLSAWQLLILPQRSHERLNEPPAASAIA
jgi:hypothetical protein